MIKVVIQTENATDNSMKISNMEKDGRLKITVSQDEIKEMDYSKIKDCLKKRGRTDGTGFKLSLFIEDYENFYILYKSLYTRKWMVGLIERYPYIFSLLDQNFGINPAIIAACIGDVVEVTEKPAAYINEYITTGYEQVDYGSMRLKVRIPSEISNKIIQGIIDYGTSVGADPDHILSVIFSVPGLNGG